MQTHSSLLLKGVRVVLEIIWVLNFVLIAIIMVSVTVKYATSDFMTFTAPIRFYQHEIHLSLTPLSTDIKDIKVDSSQGTLKFQFKRNVLNIVVTYFLILSISVLATTIIYQLRKFFNTIKHGIPFQFDNIRRLQIIAACFFGVFVLDIIKNAATLLVLKADIKALSLSQLVWDISFIPLLLWAVIFIIADVFRYGFSLQKENEEFV